MTNFPTSAATLTCLCGAVKLPGSFLKQSHFPIKDEEICHCTDCRWASGSLLPIFPNLNKPPPADVLSKTTAYRRSSRCTQYFCSTCGSKCFIDHPEMENDWFCWDGIIDPPKADHGSVPADLLSVSSHAYIEGTTDGGLVPLFLGPGEPGTKTEAALFANKSQEAAISPEQVRSWTKASLASSLSSRQTLVAKCHCGGVHLSIARADYNTNPHNVSERMMPPRPAHADKYIAWHCACRSCRLATGSTVQSWVYVPPAAITDPETGEPVVFGLDALELDANKGVGLRELKHYRSSENTLRSFCSGCGATVFYAYLGKDGDGVVDVSAGILRSESGSMARDFVYWGPDDYISHEEELVNKEIGKVLKSGFRRVGLGQ